jgi:hypothetical protein
LPVTNKALCPKTVNSQRVKENSKHVQTYRKQHYDKTAKQLKPLHLNDSVRVQMGRIWVPAKIVGKNDTRSFTVQTRDGKIYRRNRRALHRTNENTSGISHSDLNILQNSPTEPQISSQDNSPNVSTNTPAPKSPYVTRSGRVVKQNERFFSNEWDNQ